MRQEPSYKQFEGVCRICGRKYVYYNSVKRHNDYLLCDACEKAKIVATLTGEKVICESVKGSG